MNQGYHIYFNNQSFYIVSEITPNLQNLVKSEGTGFFPKATPAQIAQGIQQLDAGLVTAVVAQTTDLEATWLCFQQHFTVIQAGGGLVQNDQGEYLFIFRRGKWDLPKGKLDEGETIAQCAIREVNEETGLTHITLGLHLCDTYHVYHEAGAFILKQSVWYHMQCPAGQLLTPQLEEGITEIKWLNKHDFAKILINTFPAILQVWFEEKKAKRHDNGQIL